MHFIRRVSLLVNQTSYKEKSYSQLFILLTLYRILLILNLLDYKESYRSDLLKRLQTDTMRYVPLTIFGMKSKWFHFRGLGFMMSRGSYVHTSFQTLCYLRSLEIFNIL